MNVLNGLNWIRIAIMLGAPLPVGVLVATPLWRRQEPILGNLAGSAVIFGTAIVLILKESVELDALTTSCLDAGLSTCFPVPSSFTRYGIYAFMGLAEVITLFLISLSVERRYRDRDTAPEWRSWPKG
jgi:hypothetical protein